jgi:hypothetical protein
LSGKCIVPGNYISVNDCFPSLANVLRRSLFWLCYVQFCFVELVRGDHLDTVVDVLNDSGLCGIKHVSRFIQYLKDLLEGRPQVIARTGKLLRPEFPFHPDNIKLSDEDEDSEESENASDLQNAFEDARALHREVQYHEGNTYCYHNYVHDIPAVPQIEQSEGIGVEYYFDDEYA